MHSRVPMDQQPSNPLSGQVLMVTLATVGIGRFYESLHCGIPGFSAEDGLVSSCTVMVFVVSDTSLNDPFCLHQVKECELFWYSLLIKPFTGTTRVLLPSCIKHFYSLVPKFGVPFSQSPVTSHQRPQSTSVDTLLAQYCSITSICPRYTVDIVQ